MSRRAALLVIGVAALVVAGVIVLLATGEEESVGSFTDETGDAVVGEGVDPPPAELVPLADVTSAQVHAAGNELVFHLTVAEDIPSEIEGAGLEFRWDVSEEGERTWLVSVDFDLGPTAAIVSQTENYVASTTDDTLPGSIEAHGDSVLVTIDPSEVPGFPEEFTWQLSSSLDGSLGDAASAVAEDKAPNAGSGEYP